MYVFVVVKCGIFLLYYMNGESLKKRKVGELMKVNVIVFCRDELKRIAWRLQYRQRKLYRHEVVDFLQLNFRHNPMIEVDNLLFTREIIDSLPSYKSRYILRRIYIDKATEKEISHELNISQQGVNTWKRKALQQIRLNKKYIS